MKVSKVEAPILDHVTEINLNGIMMEFRFILSLISSLLISVPLSSGQLFRDDKPIIQIEITSQSPDTESFLLNFNFGQKSHGLERVKVLIKNDGIIPCHIKQCN